MEVAERVANCLKSFTKSLEDIRLAKRTTPRARYEESLNDELDRFKIWSGNIGAHQQGRSSLDYKLREASVIRERVTKLLDDLAESIDDGELSPNPGHPLDFVREPH
jgi:hypothetical protein